MFYLALAVFIVTYIGLLAFPSKRSVIAVISAMFYVAAGVISFDSALDAIDWNVILMLLGIMGIVELFIDSKMPLFLADWLLEKSSNVKMAIIYLSAFSGIISAFVDNVATVLILIPIALSVCKKIGISSVTPIISISLASNLQGAATLVGDATAILLGSYLDMSFFDFFFYHGKISLFWIVQIAFMVFLTVLFILFRKENKKLEIKESDFTVEVESLVPTYMLISVIFFLILASFLNNKPAITNGLISVSVLIIGLIYNFFKTSDFKEFSGRLIKQIDFETLIILMSLFIIVASINEAGVIDAMGNLFIKAGGSNDFVLYTLVVFVSVFIAAFIDNIPYVAMMLPVISAIAASTSVDPTLLYFGLLVGATVGGNLTPIGASSNITSVGMLRKNGYEVSLKEYLKISIPTTLFSVISSYAIVWIIWS